MAGTYIAASDVYGVFGQTNVEQWADVDADGDADAIAAKIESAIAEAEQYFHDRFRGSKYAVPFVESETNGLLVFKRAMARRAGTELYFARGLRDDDIEDRMQAARDGVDETISAYLSDTMEAALAKRSDQSDAPAVVG